MLENDILPWKPFGMVMTHAEWEDIVTWYVQKSIVASLDTKEGN